MINGLTQDQFIHLPPTSLHYPCDKCGKRGDYGNLMRDISDYSLDYGKMVAKEMYTALYLCGACHWSMTCEYRSMERAEKIFAEESGYYNYS